MKQFWKDYEYDIDLEWSANHPNTDFSYTQCYYHDYTIYDNNGMVVEEGFD